jgi:hypothetical protein
MTTPFNPTDTARFEAAMAKFDEANAADPNKEEVRDQQRPRELVYAERLTEWVLRLQPDASEALRLAARSQHLRRWEIPRDSFPRTREGYLQWKEKLKRYHADLVSDILKSTGYDQSMIDEVRSLNLKRELKRNPDCQTLEDALCLVFLEHQFADLTSTSTDEKMITALKKSWAKMSPQGHDAALKLSFGEREQRLLKAALG